MGFGHKLTNWPITNNTFIQNSHLFVSGWWVGWLRNPFLLILPSMVLVLAPKHEFSRQNMQITSIKV